MIERPQGGVGETLVVLGDVLGAEPHRVEVQVLLENRLFGSVDDARPADPGTPVTSQQRLQGGDQTAGAAPPHEAAIRLPFHVDGQSVGDDHEVGDAGIRTGAGAPADI